MTFNNKVIYIAGPITAPTVYQIWRNVGRAHEASLRLMKKGWAVHCPHKNTEFLGGALKKDSEEDFEAWIERDLCILSRCDAIYMLKGWRKSRGSKRELAKAKELELTIYYEEEK